MMLPIGCVQLMGVHNLGERRLVPLMRDRITIARLSSNLVTPPTSEHQIDSKVFPVDPKPAVGQ